jgi:hypothetical protein
VVICPPRGPVTSRAVGFAAAAATQGSALEAGESVIRRLLVSKGFRHGLPTSGRWVRLPDAGPNDARRLGRRLTSADKDTLTKESRPSGWDVGVGGCGVSHE